LEGNCLEPASCETSILVGLHLKPNYVLSKRVAALEGDELRLIPRAGYAREQARSSPPATDGV